jgi:hypothetical protein
VWVGWQRDGLRRVASAWGGRPWPSIIAGLMGGFGWLSETALYILVLDYEKRAELNHIFKNKSV